jgi:hypothetical protein
MTCLVTVSANILFLKQPKKKKSLCEITQELEAITDVTKSGTED